MRWEGDFGSGRELLATGKLVDLRYVDTPGFSLMRLLMDIDFLDTRVQGMGSHMGFFFENSWPTVLSSPFMQDWSMALPAAARASRCR